MINERNIGRIAAVDSLSVYVRLDDDLKSLYKSGYEEIYPVARINSYIIIPVGAEHIVAIVNRVMTREDTDLSKATNAIFLTESSRYLSATMVGTIASEKYIQGVYNYPILDNPVWYAIREDLNIIFDQKDVEQPINYNEDFYLPIGTSPAFPDYQIKINPDKMFAKHTAILGNTGSGKSCTLSAILQSMFKFTYNGKKITNSHIVIFDTNGEYKNAFNIDKKHKVNPFYINEMGLRVPYWFMNFDDMDYLFEPTTGTQAPLLKRALALAKSKVADETRKLLPRLFVNNLKSLVGVLGSGETIRTKSAILEDTENLANDLKKWKNENPSDFDLKPIIDALENVVIKHKQNLHFDKGFPKGSIDCSAVREAIDIIEDELEKYQAMLVQKTTSENRNIDLPLYYDFGSLMTSCFDYAIKEAAVSQDKLNEYVSTLKLRMQSFVDDVRLASPLMFDKRENIDGVLVQFLAFILGDFCDVYDSKNSSIYHQYYQTSDGDESHNQITIIDMSLLPFQVLETITGLIGRVILEFLSRFDKEKRGKMPVVLVLEEAQNYIPEVNRKDRESISKKVFERIAREGRKYGLSLLVSSQRPSELSKTVLSQCNSFIVHRIQNPDDQVYIKKLVSSASLEILNQMPTLPQQHVIIMGDCVRTPVVARINTANPIPNSSNPKYIENWLLDTHCNYKEIVDKWLDEDKDR